jgi:hypothetical protein
MGAMWNSMLEGYGFSCVFSKNADMDEKYPLGKLGGRLFFMN